MYQGSVLFLKEWVKGGIYFVNDMYNEYGLLSYAQICEKLGQSPDRILQYNLVCTAVRQFVLRNNVNAASHIGTPLFHGRRLVMAKDFRSQLVTGTVSVPCSQGFWKRKFGIDFNDEVWLMAYRSCKETRLRVLQWKLLHNIYPTNILLSKMKVTDTQYCFYCPVEVDFLEHFFFYCPDVRAFWVQVENFILYNLDMHVHLTFEMVLF